MAAITTNCLCDDSTKNIYVDMVGDLFHYGHMRFLRKVRTVAEEQFPEATTIKIIVGITADKYLQSYKRQPVTSNRERVETVEGCKYVDRVIPNVPLVTSAAFLDMHEIDAVFHGSDYSADQVQQWYGDVVSRNAYFSVPYSSDAVSTTVLLKTAAARHLSFLSKQALQMRSTPSNNEDEHEHEQEHEDKHEGDAKDTEQVTGFTFRKYIAPMTDSIEAERLLELLQLYGPHYQHEFGPDMKCRLFKGANNGAGMEGRSAMCVAPDQNVLRNEVVSHCCIIYNDQQQQQSTSVGLFGNVITDSRYRRRGLSKKLCHLVINDWDKKHTNGFLLLGTGSPFAAKMYQREGFVHLAGGLGKGTKGYNPEDLGEWIMIRPPQSVVASMTTDGFDRATFIETFYSGQEKKNKVLIPLRRCHWPELCLLFNLDEHDDKKLVSQGITTGVHIEEKMLRLINRTQKMVAISLEVLSTEMKEENRIPLIPLVCVDQSTERVHGIAVWNSDKEQQDVYTLPGWTEVRQLLEGRR